MSVARDAAEIPEALFRQIAEAEQRTQGVQLTTGYVTRASTTPSRTAFIEANVHVDRLWHVVNDVVNALLPIVASPIIGINDEAPTLGPYTHRERALAVFEPFAEVLAHDGFSNGCSIPVRKYHGSIPLQPRQLRALHRRFAERGAELRLLHREQIFRECLRILAREKLAWLKRELLQLRREFMVPRAHVLGGVPTHPFCN